jgi:hypothetical protein
MMWNPDILRILAMQAQSDPSLLQAANHFMPTPPTPMSMQQLQAGGQVAAPQGPAPSVGQQLSQAANAGLRKPMRSRSEWQTIGHLLGQGEMQ